MERKLQEIIMDNRKLIYSVIHHFRGSDIDDLYQAGCLGLINAYNSFNGDYHTKFTTYAYPFIVGEIYRYINSNRCIRMSPNNIKLLNSIKKASELLTMKYGRVPTDNELAYYLEIEPYRLMELRNLKSIESLDTYSEGFIKEEKALSQDLLLDLENALNSLDDDERKMIMARYYYNYTQDDVAKLFHTNQVKVSRDEKKILCKLRTKMY